MERLKVAILVPSLETGGMERVASQLSTMLTEADMDVFLFVLRYNRQISFPHSGKVVMCRFKTDESTIHSECLSYLINSRILKNEKRKHGIDVTISFSPEMNLLNILSGGRDKKILTIHNCMSLRTEVTNLAYNKRLVKIYNIADKVVTVSEWCKEDLIKKYGVSKRKIQVIYNPYTGKRSFYRKKDPVIISVGRLEAIKQQWHIVNAFKVVNEAVPDAKLWIVGKGPEKERLQKLAAELGVGENVVFLGFQKNVEEIYKHAKVLAISSKSESFSCVAAEAISNGVPVVSSDFPGGIREVLGAKCENGEYPIEAIAGIITPDHEEKDKYSTIISASEISMGNAITTLILDKELYLEKANDAYHRAELFDKEVIKEKWINILRGN